MYFYKPIFLVVSKKSDFTGTIMSFLGQNCCWCWWWLSVLLQGHQIVDHHCWKLAKRYSSSLFSNLTLDREPKFPWKIEDMTFWKHLSWKDRMSLAFHQNSTEKQASWQQLTHWWSSQQRSQYEKKLHALQRMTSWCFCLVEHVGDVKVCGVYSRGRIRVF